MNDQIVAVAPSDAALRAVRRFEGAIVAVARADDAVAHEPNPKFFRNLEIARAEARAARAAVLALMVGGAL